MALGTDLDARCAVEIAVDDEAQSAQPACAAGQDEIAVDAALLWPVESQGGDGLSSAAAVSADAPDRSAARRQAQGQAPTGSDRERLGFAVDREQRFESRAGGEPAVEVGQQRFVVGGIEHDQHGLVALTHRPGQRARPRSILGEYLRPAA